MHCIPGWYINSEAGEGGMHRDTHGITRQAVHIIIYHSMSTFSSTAAHIMKTQKFSLVN